MPGSFENTGSRGLWKHGLPESLENTGCHGLWKTRGDDGRYKTQPQTFIKANLGLIRPKQEFLGLTLALMNV